MPVIDLTYPLTPDMPVYPGTPPPEIRTIATFEKDGFRERQLTFCSHTGTHMDAPAHLLARGKTLDQFPPDRFMGNGLCIDTTAGGPGRIEWEFLHAFEKDFAISDFVLLRTGWGRYWGTPDYDQGYPTLTPDAAEHLTAFNLKGIGMDTLSVDAADTTEYPVHQMLLGSDLLIIENLACLDRLPTGRFGQLCCLPLHLAGSDGAPTRIMAITSSG